MNDWVIVMIISQMTPQQLLRAVSDAEENFDEAPMPLPMQPLATSGRGKQKHGAQELAVVTLEDVNARV